MPKRALSFVLNGERVEWEVEASDTLLRALRENGLTSVKRGCEEGECGACTVVIDDEAQKSCLVLALEVEGKSVLTTEGLPAAPGKLHPIQQAFVDEGAVQCGFCTPGFIMTTYAFLKAHPNPTDEEIRHALSGNLCRCTGYLSIIKAVKAAAAALSNQSGAAEGGR
ncbi:MAG TPA: (2Fe-2S)-binding protein [Thermotogota bacterium]|jgi:carbon-monoxide dehydrogenase small subunit|nr:(2Fe-2S)-binding protein [Thermotogota bacterium]NLH18607.1 (2Fe-2S)-binding protein [Thermotogaceae bacterium]OQC30664.1 MAG: Carbon monoxide dehydrogenase small chain [Thermotogota bacterium ADurb.Bin062]HNW47351.1 (2Fe-2S)-binding protein [Thermotogota bacterium]HNY81333.1 (2Fe-2S)-binding protein [Thermotogota bacterium]